MIDASSTHTPEQPPDGGRAPRCPSWCVNAPTCDGDHGGKLWGTVATGGLPPAVDSIEPPPYNTVCVRAQFPEVSKLPPGVALFGAWGGEDWEVELTTDQAAALARALEAAVDEALALVP